jgi:ABC-type uncharacterized transport system permease subunit
VLQFVLSGVSIGAIYGLLGLALALSFYVTRVINFAQGQMLTVAIVVAASLSEAGYNPWIGIRSSVISAETPESRTCDVTRALHRPGRILNSLAAPSNFRNSEVNVVSSS